MSREKSAGVRKWGEVEKRTGIKPVGGDFIIAGPRPPHPVRVPQHRARRFIEQWSG